MLTVNDLMTSEPKTVPPEAPLRRVVELMKKEGCRQLPIVAEGKLIGIITDRDVRLAVNSPLSVRVRQVNDDLMDRVSAQSCMTPDPVTVTPDTPAYRAAEILSRYRFGALPVLDGDVLVGIISITDILDYFAEAERTSSAGQQSTVIDQE